MPNAECRMATTALIVLTLCLAVGTTRAAPTPPTFFAKRQMPNPNQVRHSAFAID
jgi:hypothetical protein